MQYLGKEISVRAGRVLNNYRLDEDAVGQMSDDELLRLPGCGVEALAEIRRWATGVEPERAPSLDNMLVEQWIAELQAQQDRYPATPKGYREAAILAWKIGTLRSLLS